MTGTRWGRLLTVYALIAVVVATALLFVGNSVAPCLGGPLSPDANARCVAQWEARRSPLERTVTEHPILLGALVFLAPVAVTAIVEIRSTRSRRPRG